LQLANFTQSAGVTVPGIGPIVGVDQFLTGGNRRSNGDYNNFWPRLGAAYQLNQKTVYAPARVSISASTTPRLSGFRPGLPQRLVLPAHAR
jgi:hypothetical protein